MWQSLDSLLSFAFDMGELCAAQAIDYAREAPDLSPDRMCRLDRHAQASMIVAAVKSHLKGEALLFVVATYAHGDEKFAATRELGAALAGVCSGRARLAASLVFRQVERHRERQPSQREVAEFAGVSRRTVTDIELRVKAKLHELATQAEASLEAYFEATGLLVVNR